MDWSETLAHPSLRDLPFKIELNEHGQIVMTPFGVRRSLRVGEIVGLIGKQRADGSLLVRCAIDTRKGTKVADVAWVSKERKRQIIDEASASIAPEVCVEVMLPGVPDKEVRKRRKLYFDRGALEVWICDTEGAMRFFNPKRRLKRSQLFPSFPINVET